MDKKFLSTEEQDYVIAKSKELKIQSRMNEIAKSIAGVFGNSGSGMKVIRGVKVEITFGLDDISPEIFDKIVPEVRKNIEEYHLLKECLNEVKSDLQKLHNFDVFEIKIKGEN